MAQTTFGQTDALALAVADFLNTRSSSFCTPITAERRFALVTDLASIPAYDAPASVHVFPDVESTEQHGLATYASDYAIHIFIQRQTSGTDEEAACALLAQLRSEIIESLKSAPIAIPNAVHPIGQRGLSMRNARSADRTGLYNLARLLEAHVFESDTILIFKAAA